MRRTKRAASFKAMLFTLVLVLGLVVAPASADNGGTELKSDHRNTAYDDDGFDDADCGGLTDPVVWHFVLTQPDGLQGQSLTAHFEDADEDPFDVTVDGDPTGGNVHFWVGTGLGTTLITAIASPGGGQLVLSHICTQVAPPTQSITIIKETVGGDGLFGFESDLPAPDDEFDITTDDGTGQHGPVSVEPGTYDVTEVSQPEEGWLLTNIACDNDSVVDMDEATVAVSVEEGEHVECTFTNTFEDDPDVTIEVVKIWLAEFEEGEFPGAVLTMTVDGQTFSEGEPATMSVGTEYSVSEDAPPGWTVVECPEGAAEGAEPNPILDAIENEGVGPFIATESGSHVVCNDMDEVTIIENGDPTPSVDIELVKLWFDADGNEVDQPGGDWAVTLTERRGGEDLPRATLQGDTTSVVRSLVEGRDYTVTESELPGGWSEVDGCEGLSIPDDTVAIGTGTFSADEAGLHVVCNQQAEVLAEVLEEEVEVLDELPRTGIPTTLLTLFGLLGIALGGGLLGRSRS